MSRRSDAPVRAILGPTNTGKTYLAIERMCGHSSGVIGFPLRLLAREVYDRVVAIKGEKQVALLTGEERIVPPQARYFLCTAESMPIPGADTHDNGDFQRDFAFAAIDEAQLGIDPERGHVFTDRMLRARGREETLILGSETLKPIIRELLPEAEVVTRPRFSTLRYAGSVKLSRLPPRSAVVAFSAEQVYALAEMLRRFRGGAAVVMGALSPATRNAQVAMFQRGEVDYLVATDAIGMGLNMDVTHVAFAGLEKFDGRRDRRLTIPEMAQIAGRAGRHQKDGTFGTLGLSEESGGFSEEEINAIEEHRFRPLDHVYWRNAELDFTDVKALIRSLEAKSADPILRSAPEAIDLAVLKTVAEDPAMAARKGVQARRLWAVCGLPDFRKVGPMHHARMVRRLFSYIGEGGHVPHEWFAAEVTRLDNMSGDIEALADRLAGIRSWAYIAHRSDWLQEPAKWAERTREVEARLSDALHERLTQRFVDRRTAVLVRDIGARGADALPMTVAADGEVSVGPEPIGHLTGFEFKVDPTARLADKRLLLAAAERRLGEELDRRAKALVEAEDTAFQLVVEANGNVAVSWDGHILARLAPGRSLLEPALRTSRALDRLSAPVRSSLRERLERWLDTQIDRHLRPLERLSKTATDPGSSPGVRAIAAMLADAGGLLPRKAALSAIAHLEQADRQAVHKLGVRLGPLDVFLPLLLKPAAQHWRAALLAVRQGQTMPALPAAGAATLTAEADPRGASLAYRRLGATWLRVDLADRL
ncbi:MAG TPA: helicase-related protein, partial [Sphingomicrobium sp.]